VAYSTLLARKVARDEGVHPTTSFIAKDGKEHPRIISLGGDHTIVRTPVLASDIWHYEPWFRGTAHNALVAQNLWSCLCDTLRRSSGYLGYVPRPNDGSIQIYPWDFLLPCARGRVVSQ